MVFALIGHTRCNDAWNTYNTFDPCTWVLLGSRSIVQRIITLVNSLVHHLGRVGVAKFDVIDP